MKEVEASVLERRLKQHHHLVMFIGVKKGNDEDEFNPIDANAEEYRGTMNYLPHPELVVKHRNLLENNCFQIEVSNFIGSTVEKISGNRLVKLHVTNSVK